MQGRFSGKKNFRDLTLFRLLIITCEMDFSLEQLENLQNMLDPGKDDEYDGHVYGSALNPSSLHGG